MTSAFADVRLIILILTLLVRTMYTTPGNKATGHTRQKKIEPWLNPCGEENQRVRHHNRENKLGAHNYAKINVTGRTKASPKALRRIRNIVARTCDHLLDLDPHLISKINCKEVPSENFNVQFDWAPKNLTKWYKEKIKCLNKTMKVNTLLPKLHEGLQNFSEKFENLRVKSDNDVIPECDEKRPALIQSVADRLLVLLCDVEKAIMMMGLQQPQRLKEPVGRQRQVLWEDYTTRHLYEWSVLFVYKVFLEDWNKIIRQIVGRKGDRKCKRRKLDENAIQKIPLPD